jgi:hypothetical protein
MMRDLFTVHAAIRIKALAAFRAGALLWGTCSSFPDRT